MDRFIADVRKSRNLRLWRFKIQYGQIYRKADEKRYPLSFNLKSNMDRFIAFEVVSQPCECLNLKSNMDRFIATTMN